MQTNFPDIFNILGVVKTTIFNVYRDFFKIKKKLKKIEFSDSRSLHATRVSQKFQIFKNFPS